jgi:O-methyltransferase
MEKEFWRYREKIQRYTMTSIERQYNLFKALNYVHRANIPGSFVECGVYRGGSSLLAAMVFADLGEKRDLWLYDTFAGMTPPTEHDFKRGSNLEATRQSFIQNQKDDHNEWCYAGLEDVKSCIATSHYTESLVHYVVGDILKTIPDQLPDRIAILRLDTDFYDSTKHELEHLYDRLESGGILIIDDYGSWEGARKAVDDYFDAVDNPPFLARIDETARIGQKP